MQGNRTKRRIIDITGKRFGRYVVNFRVENSKDGITRWNCTCDCGKMKIILGRSLREGKTRSCGCLAKELSRSRGGENHYFFGKHPSEDTRKKLSKAKRGKNHPCFGKKRSEEYKQRLSSILKGRIRSEETKRKISLSKKGKKPWNKGKRFIRMSGSKNPRWKGGVTPLLHQIRNCFEMNFWRVACRKRDNYTCQSCGARSKKGKSVYLNVHHCIKPFAQILEEYNIKTLEEAQSCKELWDITNGVTLCKDCHKKVHSKK